MRRIGNENLSTELIKSRSIIWKVSNVDLIFQVDIAYAPFIDRFQHFALDVKKYDITAGRPKLAAWIEVQYDLSDLPVRIGILNLKDMNPAIVCVTCNAKDSSQIP